MDVYLASSLGYLRDLLLLSGFPAEHVLFGSVAAHLRGIEMPRPCGDVDVFVTRRVWSKMLVHGGEVRTPRAGDPPFLEFELRLADEEPDGPPIHVFYDWTARDGWLSVEECFSRAEPWGFWRVIPVSLLVEHKRSAGGELAKHAADIAALTG